MSQESLDPRWGDLVAVLRELRPAASQIDRDQLFFCAGQAAAEAPVLMPPKQLAWRWPLATVAAAAISALATLGAVRFSAPAEQTGGAPIHAVRLAPSQAFPAPDRLEEPPHEIAAFQGPEVSQASNGNEPYEYLAMRRLVATAGVDALPEPMTNSASASSTRARGYRDLLSDYLRHL